MTRHTCRGLVITTIEIAKIINEELEPIYGPNSIGAEFIPTENPNDSETTHLGCDTQFIEEQVQPFINAFGNMVFWCDVDATTYELRATNIPALTPKIGQIVKMKDVLDVLNLKARTSQMI